MKKRTYDPKLRRKKIEEAALSRFREVRERIDPALLKRARKIIARKAGEAAAEQKAAKPDTHIDKEKNMTTVMKFMELKKGDEAFKSRLQDFIRSFN